MRQSAEERATAGASLLQTVASKPLEERVAAVMAGATFMKYNQRDGARRHVAPAQPPRPLLILDAPRLPHGRRD